MNNNVKAMLDLNRKDEAEKLYKEMEGIINSYRQGEVEETHFAMLDANHIYFLYNKAKACAAAGNSPIAHTYLAHINSILKYYQDKKINLTDSPEFDLAAKIQYVAILQDVMKLINS